jgi:hypothetical protein
MIKRGSGGVSFFQPHSFLSMVQDIEEYYTFEETKRYNV